MEREMRIAARVVALIAIAICVSSCGGGGAKAAKAALQQVVKSKGATKAVKGIGRHADDVVRHVSTTKVTCATCGGLCQVDFVDEYGNYEGTGPCPDCDGAGTVTEYEFK